MRPTELKRTLVSSSPPGASVPPRRPGPGGKTHTVSAAGTSPAVPTTSVWPAPSAACASWSGSVRSAITAPAGEKRGTSSSA